MQAIKPYILPVAIVLGLLLHSWIEPLVATVPYVIFSILLLNFCAVNIKTLKFNRLDLWVMIFQTVVSLGGYWLLRLLTDNEILAQALLLAVMCPVASSVVVVSSALGADRRTTTGYTIYGNLLVTILAPMFFSFIGTHQDMPFADSFLLIFERIASIIALPFFVALLLQIFLPRVKEFVGGFKEWALPLWALALLITLGSTIDYIFLYHKGNELTIVWLAVIAIAVCALQFGIGKIIGARFGERISGGQLLGQKNTALGIWMATVYLAPLASVVLAFYSIAQNLFNSWQMWRYSKQHARKAHSKLRKGATICLTALALCGLTSCHSSKKVHSRPGSPHVENIHVPKADRKAKKIVEEAYTWLGTPYKYAGAEKGVGTDCSGMVMTVYEDVTGIKLPRNSAKQAEFCDDLDADNVRIGDLVFFATGKDPDRISHVGIIVDDLSFIHASSSKGVVISTLTSDYYRRTFRKFGRVPRR